MIARNVAEIEVRDADGMLQETMTLNLPVRAVTQSDRERYIERRRDALASVQRTTASRQRELTILGQTEFAEDYPYFDELLIAASGDIWVRGYVAHGDTIATWHVYRPNGEAKGRLTVPSDWSLLHAGSDFLIVRATDELDVEFVTKRSYR